jgi:hypothetical protein
VSAWVIGPPLVLAVVFGFRAFAASLGIRASFLTAVLWVIPALVFVWIASRRAVARS